MHAILNQHQDIFIPDKEIHLLDMDNPIQHPDFNSFSKECWHTSRLENSPSQYWHWYHSQFQSSKKINLLVKTQQHIWHLSELLSA